MMSSAQGSAPIVRSSRALRALAVVALGCSFVPGAAASADAQPAAGPPPSIEQKTKGMERHDGFLPIYWDAREGKLWLEISRFDEELLYYTSLPAGIGSNDIGLDRGQLGPQQVVVFRRVGPKVLMVQPNYLYRASSDDAAERRSVEEAFATSVLHGFVVEAETAGRVLVDATTLVMRDAHDVVGTLRRTGQGSFQPDASRSALHLPRTRAFPKNTEIEVTLTFVTDGDPGAWLQSVAPNPRAVTVRQHHSFVELPGPGYRPREADPRAGYFGVSYADYSAPLGEPMVRRYVARHRLDKKDPAAPISEAVSPIVYYLDPGVPEPVRSALLDGARWWAEAFDALGYRDAFRVEILPEDSDPMDVRYNVIQWVHRSTRGWSYGYSVTDPRTGEILKGHVSLGSLRVRQDYLLAEGLLSPYVEGDETPAEPAEMALARIRQLSAHEVGHTLGLDHNFIASAQGPDGRASVMDYPHPRTRLRPDGTVDLSDAYAVGLGAWDRVAIAYGYQHFPEGTDERAALEAILTEARDGGLTFFNDADARPRSSAHPRAHLWDNGTDPVAELDRVMEVRRAALARFGETAIRAGRPLATLEETLVPLYLHHRYQIEAAVKVLGGIDYEHALRGDGQGAARPVPPIEQRRALEAVLRTVRPSELAFPRTILPLLPPRPPGYPLHRELFDRRTSPTFDPLTPAEAAADLSLSILLEPERMARLVTQPALDPALPGLVEVLERLAQAVLEPPTEGPYEAEIARSVQSVLVARLVERAATAPMPQVRALAEAQLHEIRRSLEAAPGADASEQAHRRYLAGEIRRFLERRDDPELRLRPAPAPPGSPIG
jgi:hypothetical protein